MLSIPFHQDKGGKLFSMFRLQGKAIMEHDRQQSHASLKKSNCS